MGCCAMDMKLGGCWRYELGEAETPRGVLGAWGRLGGEIGGFGKGGLVDLGGGKGLETFKNYKSRVEMAPAGG